MSDFLTNIVTRSFSPASSPVKPMMSAYPTPAAHSQFSDPFAEAPIASENDKTEATPVANPLATRPSRGAAPIGPAAVTNDHAVIQLETVADEPIETIRPVHRDAGQTEERTPNVHHTPKTVDAAASETSKQTPSKPLTSETPAPAVQKIERPRETPSSAPNTASIDTTAPARGILLQRQAGGKTNGADTTHHAPLIAEASTRHIAKRIQDQISHSKPRVSPDTETTGPLIIEQIVERTTAPLEQRPQQTSAAFTTLVPKPAPSSPFTVKVKPRPNMPTSDAHETSADLPAAETVINVAIGRIEVRAISQPAAKRERHPSGPKLMSLDDYVQQRSRGTQ
jgi:hypothetical protein